jgi:hypothetical protein
MIKVNHRNFNLNHRNFNLGGPGCGSMLEADEARRMHDTASFWITLASGMR